MECVDEAVAPTRGLLTLAPVVVTLVNSFTPEFNVDVGGMPNAQEATRHLFPNVSVVTDDGNVYVVDGSNYRVQKFSSSGAYLTKWGSSGTGPGQFTGLSGNCATDAAGNVYVADAHRVQKFSSSGAFVKQWGSLGSGDGQFNAPNSVTVDQAGYVYVVDRLNSRVEKFTSIGTFVTKWSVGGNTSDIAVDPVGDVYTLDDNGHLTRYSASGTYAADAVADPAAAGEGRAPAGSTVDATKPTDADPATATFVETVQPGTPNSPTFELKATCCVSLAASPHERMSWLSAIERAPPSESTPTGWPLMSSHFLLGSIEPSSQSGLT